MDGITNIFGFSARVARKGLQQLIDLLLKNNDSICVAKNRIKVRVRKRPGFTVISSPARIVR